MVAVDVGGAERPRTGHALASWAYVVRQSCRIPNCYSAQSLIACNSEFLCTLWERSTRDRSLPGRVQTPVPDRDLRAPPSCASSSVPSCSPRPLLPTCTRYVVWSPAVAIRRLLGLPTSKHVGPIVLAESHTSRIVDRFL